MDQLLKYLIVWCFAGTLFNAFCQISDKDIVNSLNDSSFHLGSSSPKLALVVARKSLGLSKNSKYKMGEIMAYCRIGNALVELDDLEGALLNYNQAENQFNKSREDSIILAKIYIYQSPIYRRQGNMDLALSKYAIAFKIAERRSNGALMASALTNMSIIHKERGNYKRALHLLHKSINVLPKNEKDEFGNIYNGIGTIYQDEGRTDEALKAFRKAESYFKSTKNLNAILRVNINIGNCFWDLDEGDSAAIYYRKALPFAIQRSFRETEATIYQNIGALFAHELKLDSARFYYQKSLAIKDEVGDIDGALETMKSIGEVAYRQDNIIEALSVYNQAYKLALSLDYLEDLEHITRELSACYQRIDNWDEAIRYLDLSKSYRDSISYKLSDALVYEIKFEQEKRNAAELALKVKKRDDQLEKQTYFLWTLGILALCVVIILYVLFKLNRNKRKVAEIGIENLEKEKEISELIKKQEQAELNAMFDGQETERNRIALELHDKLGGMLSVVKLYFKSIDKQINNLKDENIKQYQKANVLLDEACDETRKIAHQLSSKRISEIGLFATIKSLQNQINDSGELNFTLHTHGKDSELPRILQNSVYRILQELMNNVTKHSQAKEVSIQLNVFSNLFNVIVEDDGIGFDVNNLIDKNGLGLREIEVRVKTMNGQFTIDSGRGVGTTITIDLPLNEEQ